MIHFPILRWGEPYQSLEVEKAVHFATGEQLAEVSQANGGMVGRDLRRAQKARDALRDIPIAELVEMGQEITADDVVLNEDYAYPKYGVPSAETNEAIRLCARMEGMMTDPVYEGKSMQGMIDLVSKGFFPVGSRVLYAHLGGVPAINAYSYIYRNG